jgi:hypothetical protein
MNNLRSENIGLAFVKENTRKRQHAGQQAKSRGQRGD